MYALALPEADMPHHTAACLLLLAPVALVAAPADAPKPGAPKPGAGVSVTRDVHFDTIDGQKLYLDVAVPPGDGPHPCVVMFHGGAWTMGSRRDLSTARREGANAVPSVIETVAARGFVAVSAGYRLAPKHQFPAQIQDARAAVRFVRAKATDYKIDPARVGAAGFSAGGHLALLLGLADKVDGWDAGSNTGHSCKVSCVVDFFGPADLSLYAKSPGLEDAYMVPVFGKRVKTDPEIYKRASPVSYVGKGAPPVLMVHGTFDLVVPIVHSEQLCRKLQDAGATAELIPVRGAGHGWDGATLARTTDDALKFLDTHLRGAK